MVLQFELAASARVDVLVSAIEPKQASQVVKDLSALLPLEQAKVGCVQHVNMLISMRVVDTILYSSPGSANIWYMVGKTLLSRNLAVRILHVGLSHCCRLLFVPYYCFCLLCRLQDKSVSGRAKQLSYTVVVHIILVRRYGTCISDKIKITYCTLVVL